MYPFVSAAWFEGLLTLHKLYKKLCASSVNVTDFEQSRPYVVRGLVMLELIMPAIALGILFHELIHIYDFCMIAGPSYTYWMYIFERLVSNMSRQIHDKARPARNLANNLAKVAGLENFLNVSTNYLDTTCERNKKTAALFRRYGLTKDQKDIDDTDLIRAPRPAFVLPTRVTGQAMDWDRMKCQMGSSVDVSAIEDMYSHGNDNAAALHINCNIRSINILRLGIKGPTGFRIRIGGCVRACERTEPPIGDSNFTRRCSGFKMNDGSGLVAKIQDFYLIDKQLFALVHVWQPYIDEESGIFRLIVLADAQSHVIIAEKIGPVVIFTPWTGRSNIIDATRQYVAPVRQRDHT